MNNEFYTAVKSTVDKLGHDMATALSADAMDLDDNATTDAKLLSVTPGVVWQLMTVSEVPIDPMYEVSFIIGAKTTQDPGSYKLIDFNAQINQSVYKGAGIKVCDYSGAVAGAEVGVLHVVDVDLQPQVDGDVTSGIRFMAVSCKGLRFP